RVALAESRCLPRLPFTRGLTLEQPFGGEVFLRIPAAVAVQFAIARELPLEALEAQVESEPRGLGRVFDADGWTVRDPYRERASHAAPSLRTVVVEEGCLSRERLHLDGLECGVEPGRDAGSERAVSKAGDLNTSECQCHGSSSLASCEAAGHPLSLSTR